MIIYGAKICTFHGKNCTNFKIGVKKVLILRWKIVKFNKKSYICTETDR